MVATLHVNGPENYNLHALTLPRRLGMDIASRRLGIWPPDVPGFEPKQINVIFIDSKHFTPGKRSFRGPCGVLRRLDSESPAKTILINFAHILRGALWLHSIALSALVKVRHRSNLVTPSWVKPGG